MRRSNSPLNAASAPNEPRLSPTDEQARAGVGRQVGPAGVDGVEQLPAGVAGAVLVDQVRQPRRQVGVLHRHRRGVAAGQVLQRVRGCGVDPPGTGGGRHHQDGPREAAGPFEVVDGEPGPDLDVRGRVETGVGADRGLRRAARDRRDLGGGRAARDVRAAVAAERVPADERTGSAGAQGRVRCPHAGLGVLVLQREHVVGEAHGPVDDHAVDHQDGADDDDGTGHHVRGARADPAPQPAVEMAVEPAQAARGGDERHEGQYGGHRQHEERGERGVLCHTHQVADPVLPVAAEDDRDGQRDGRRHGEQGPRRRPRCPGVAVGHGPPRGRREHAEPVADGGVDPADQALHEPAARQQRGGERQAGEQQGEAQPGQRVGQVAPHPRRGGRRARDGAPRSDPDRLDPGGHLLAHGGRDRSGCHGRRLSPATGAQGSMIRRYGSWWSLLPP